MIGTMQVPEGDLHCTNVLLKQSEFNGNALSKAVADFFHTECEKKSAFDRVLPLNLSPFSSQ